VYSKEGIVRSEFGLYNKAVAIFIQKANEFSSQIWVEVDDRRVNAKSLLGLLSLGVTQGTKIRISAEGADAEKAVDDLVDQLSVAVLD
jgi:phosphocarrier protein